MLTLKYIIGQDQRKLTPFELHDGDTFDLSKDPDVNKNKVQAMQYNSGMDEIFLELYEDQKDSTGALIPFDLSGANIMFEGWKPDGTYIVDSDIMTPISLQQGQCRINLPDQAFAVYGSYKQAFFRIYRDNKNIATLEFTFNVRADMVQGQIKSVDWIGPVHEILEKTKEDYENHKKSLDDAVSNAIAEYTKEMNTLKALGVSVDTSLSGLLQKIKNNNLFTQAEADAFKQAIESKLSGLDKVYEHTYPTLADLQADKNVISGQVVKTGGYYALNDGGSAIYDITDAKPDSYYETLQNGLYAKLRYTSKIINVAQFGVNPSQPDNYEKIQMIFDNYAQDANVYFPNGLYRFSKTLILDKTYCHLVGDARTELQKTTTDLAGYTCIFNQRTIDLDKTDVALIVGPANNQNETVYHHQIKFESMRFISPDTTNPARSNYGIVAIGTAYMSFDNCFLYGFYLNLKQYESFGLNLTQTQSNGALAASLFLDKSIHVSANGCGFEGIRPQSSAVTLTNGSIATITDSVITVNGVAVDSNSDLTLVGCSYETNYQTFRATAGSTIDVTGGDIERHQDPANNADTPLIYCTDGSNVSVTNAKWRWQNYSGEPTWDHLLAYSTNKGCKIVVINCQLDGFPKLTHYDGGADYVVWDNDLDVYKKATAQVNPMDGVTVQGQTLTRDYGGQCFLNLGFTTTKDLNYMDPLISFPPSYIPWDGCYIQFLQQNVKKTYQAFTQDGKIKVYDTVPAGTEAILTFSYQAKD
ncbi:BppU family phage baseplate upper protein [Limosilactobacillus reuteri]|uniref:BppU family phage baseplate upper protein n=1 Tax=Limosilactobacillus reuteri TaxID=1598 RepID=UPI003996AEFD